MHTILTTSEKEEIQECFEIECMNNTPVSIKCNITRISGLILWISSAGAFEGMLHILFINNNKKKITTGKAREFWEPWYILWTKYLLFWLSWTSPLDHPSITSSLVFRCQMQMHPLQNPKMILLLYEWIIQIYTKIINFPILSELLALTLNGKCLNIKKKYLSFFFWITDFKL